MAIHENVLSHIEKNKEELFNLTREAVRFPSVCGQEGEAQQWIAGKYKSLGLDVHLLYANDERIRKHPAYIESGFPFDQRPNVIAILKGIQDGKSLTLNGHIDVVSPEPLESWGHDPWGGHIEDGKLYGRGSMDMKSGLMANYFALKTLVELGIKPLNTVLLQSVVEEEAGGGGGTLACLLDGYTTDGFIATEPHDLRITISHAGVLYFRVKVKGKSSHGGMAHMGVDAIEKIIPIFYALKQLDQERANQVKYELFASGSGRAVHLSMGTLHAGDWPSTVAGWASLECRISFVPGENRESIMNMVEEVVNNASSEDQWLLNNPPVIEWFGWQADPWYQDPSHPYVKSFMNTAQNITGKQLDIIGRASGNDARFTQYFPGMAGLCFGPSGGNMHGANEFVDLDSLVKTCQVLAVHILDWCGFE